MILDIRPQSKERAKANGNQFYTPPKTREYEDNIALLYKANGGKYHNGKVRVYAMFCYKTKDRKKLMTPKTSTPDIDNLLKALFDGLTKSGAAWKDDAQVTEVNASKMWSTDDYIELEVQEY